MRAPRERELGAWVFAECETHTATETESRSATAGLSLKVRVGRSVPGGVFARWFQRKRLRIPQGAVLARHGFDAPDAFDQVASRGARDLGVFDPLALVSLVDAFGEALCTPRSVLLRATKGIDPVPDARSPTNPTRGRIACDLPGRHQIFHRPPEPLGGG